MKSIKFTKERILLLLILIMSSIINLYNLSIEGTANQYYAAAIKSMTMNLKNFFFVSFDPAGFVSIDKPPVGFWLQAMSAKIFGYSGWSILLPQALAGIISVWIIYYIVKRSFGSAAGLISALCLAITPVFVAVSRNNTIDNTLVLVLLLACLALSVAAEKGRTKYLIISMVLIGIGFNIKMLQAYMIVPAIYVTYLLSTSVSIRKRLLNITIGTVILLIVSLSWAFIVDLVPAANRPYVDSSTNNTVMELILGHNGAERISLSTSNNGMGSPGGMAGNRQFRNGDDANAVSGATQKQPGNNTSTSSGNNQNPQGGDMQFPPQGGNGGAMPLNPQGQNNSSTNGKGQNNSQSFGQGNMNFGGGPIDGGFIGGNMGGPNGGSGGLAGSFGAQVKSSITRLFDKNMLSDQIVWFIPLALLGFIAAAIREKLRFRLDNKRKQSLILWFMWFLPVFLYFSYNTGTFHSYYLTMLAPPVAALAGIGLTEMWELYTEGGIRSWFMPIALAANGGVQLLMLSYFASSSGLVKALMIPLVILCFGSSLALCLINLLKIKESDGEEIENGKSIILRVKLILTGLAFTGLLLAPFAGSSAAMFHKLNSTVPAAGLELLSNNQSGDFMMNNRENGTADAGLIQFLKKNKSNEKYILVVSSANEASGIIISSGESVMALGGFLGSDKAITLEQFKELAKKGEIRYVMTGGMGGRGNADSNIMAWVQENGKLVAESDYSAANSSSTTSSNSQNFRDFGGRNAGQLYDLKAYTDKSK